MSSRHTLLLASLTSTLFHVGIAVAPLWEPPEPRGQAIRIAAILSASDHGEVGRLSPRAKPAPRPRRPEIAPASGVATTSLEDATQEPVTANSEPVSVVVSEDAVAPSVGAASSTPELNPVVGPSTREIPLVLPPASDRLPRSGRVSYIGSASLLSVMGLVSWEHDGVRFKARLGAGVLGATSSFNYESTGRLIGPQLVSDASNDSRRGKETKALIDNVNGVVRMQRGDDVRERRIAGLAVALSSLPLALACLDEGVEKAALFVVGDFWVEDSVVINRGSETLTLSGATIETRHFQSKINNGKTVDIWLAPAWRNAPARIRYNDGSVVVDLKATEVEIDGGVLLQARPTSGE